MQCELTSILRSGNQRSFIETLKSKSFMQGINLQAASSKVKCNEE